MEIVSQGAIELLKPQRIRFNTSPKATLSSQDFRASTRSSPVSVNSHSNRILSSTPQPNKSLKRVISPTDNSSQRAGNSKNKSVVVTSNSLCTGPRPVILTENLQEDVLLREASD